MASLSPVADLTLEKGLPHSAEAERAVLGAVMLDNQLFDQAVEVLRVEDFYLPAHRQIFDKMSALSTTSQAIDILTLRNALKEDSLLDEIGGSPYLASLTDGVPQLTNVENYARIVKEKSLLRKLIHSSNSILMRCLADELTAVELLEKAEKDIFDISQEKVGRGFVSLHDLLAETYEHIGSLSQRKELVTGVATGFAGLDSMTSGLQPADLIIVAARPGCGKTSLALNIAQYAAVAGGKRVGVFSLEMGGRQLVTRLLCGEARVDSHNVRSGRLSERDWQALAGALSRLGKAPIFVDDTPGISVMELRSKARRLKAEHGLDLLVIDYLQLMSGRSSNRQRFETREKEIAAISRSLKGLAKELDIPVVALSQLSRKPEDRRGNHRPRLSDLRESGSLEQDADVVLFIYRQDMYKKPEDLEEESGIVDIIIGKQRNGPTGVVKLVFIEKWTKFENPSLGEDPSESLDWPFSGSEPS